MQTMQVLRLVFSLRIVPYEIILSSHCVFLCVKNRRDKETIKSIKMQIRLLLQSFIYTVATSTHQLSRTFIKNITARRRANCLFILQ